MEFNTIFVNGPLDGQMAFVVIMDGKFRVGVEFLIKGSIYKVLDGPAACSFEISQKSNPYLCVRSQFVEKEYGVDYGSSVANTQRDTEV